MKIATMTQQHAPALEPVFLVFNDDDELREFIQILRHIKPKPGRRVCAFYPDNTHEAEAVKRAEFLRDNTQF